MKTGDPNGEGLVFWPESDSQMGYLKLGDSTNGFSGELAPIEQLMEEFVIQRFHFPMGE